MAMLELGTDETTRSMKEQLDGMSPHAEEMLDVAIEDDLISFQLSERPLATFRISKKVAEEQLSRLPEAEMYRALARFFCERLRSVAQGGLES